MQSFWHKNGVADNFHNFQLHFIVQLCEGVVLLRFADEGVALHWVLHWLWPVAFNWLVILSFIFV